MFLTRRWAIIGSIALAHVGVAVGYQAFLTGNAPSLIAQTANAQSQAEPPLAAPSQPLLPEQHNTTTTPLIPVPMQPSPTALPHAVKNAKVLENAANMPASPKGFSLLSQGILPVSAQEAAKPLTMEPPPPAAKQNDLIVPPPGPSAGPAPLPQQPAPNGAPLPVVTQQSPMAPKPELKQPANCPWSLNVEIIKGRTHVTAQNGKDVKFTVSCEKLDMETPGGAIHAAGKVKLATDSIEGNCDRLTISWQEDVVILDKVQLKCKLEGHDADLHAEQLRVRLSRVVSTSKKEQTYSLWSDLFRVR